ncbi:MAG TPA: response regulator, partial [Pirellulales bacterium]|nr:response regulator [Pirellulales bacterium]
VADPQSSSVSILIVDDEPKNLSVLETVLVDPIYRLVRASSADEALLALIAGDFALIILDVHMPGMNGFELAEMIKQRKKTAEVPIIFLTAYYSDDQYVLEGYSTGAVDYLHKPINPIVLRSKVAVFVELYTRRRECELIAKSLMIEVTERRRAQEELVRLNQELERRVEARTAELMAAGAAQRESEERLRLANEASGTGMWEWNLQTNRVTWSAECYAIYGLSEAEFDGTWEGFLNLIQPSDRVRVREALMNAVSHRDPFACDFRILRPDGTTRWIANRGRAFFDRELKTLRLIGTLIDISYRKETELQLLEADRRKNEFLASLAHELRNPLAPIRNSTEILLLTKPADPQLEWAANVIDRQVRQLTRLVDDLLEMSRITTGKLEVRRQTVDMASVIRASIETSLPLLEQGRHQLSVELPAKPVLVEADPIRMAQVLSNLLNNAAKYTDPGGQVQVQLTSTGGQAVISVRDSGTGIPAELLPHVFDMFMQADRHADRSQSGLGIGLTLVKRLVEMHEGTIEARSEGTGRGSEFVVRLPLAQRCEPLESPPIDRHALVGSLRILVVDDNVDAANSLAEMLKLIGNDVRVAHDGLAGLHQAEAFRPQVALLDLGMPGLDGCDVCRRIKQQDWGKAITVVALTGWGQEEDRRRTGEAGFDHHLIKPVDFGTLSELLAKIAPLG